MSNLQLTNDLITDALFRAGEPTDGSSDFQSRVLPYINRGYEIIWNGGSELSPDINEDWWWLRATSPGTIILQPKISGGTVNPTNNSNSVGTSSTVATGLAGYSFKVDDHSDVFVISSATGTTITLDSVYTGNTATSKAYRAFKTRYDLATDMLTLLQPMRAFQNNEDEVNGVDASALQRDWPVRDIQGGVPHAFARVGHRVVQFSHFGGASSGKLIRVEYDYLRIPPLLTPASGDAPLIPIEYRPILSDYVAYSLALDKEDNKAGTFLNSARAGLLAMKNRQRWEADKVGRDLGQIKPRQDDLSKHRRPLRTESGMLLG